MTHPTTEPEYLPRQPECTATSQDDRLLAAAAYLAPLAGFPIVGPCLMYAWKRHTSPFISNHALQALGVQLLGMVLAPVGVVLYGLWGVLVGLLAAHGGGGGRDWTGLAFLGLLFLLLPIGASLLLTCRGAWLALHGRTFHLPWWSSVVSRVLST